MLSLGVNEENIYLVVILNNNLLYVSIEAVLRLHTTQTKINTLPRLFFIIISSLRSCVCDVLDVIFFFFLPPVMNESWEKLVHPTTQTGLL